MQFIFIAIIILVVYVLLCFYVGYNGWVWLSKSFPFQFKKLYTVGIVFLSLSLFIGQFTKWLPFKLIGYFWFIIIGYGLILLPIANLLYYLLKKRGVLWIGFGIISILGIVMILGSYYAWNPVVKHYEVTIEKDVKREKLTLLMASDFHLGEIVGKNHLERFIKIVNETNPDIVLLPGDLIDDYIDPFKEQQMGEVMEKINAPLGVYATTGNHDYYGDDAEEIIQTMNELGIEMLTDESVLIEDFYIIGRNDETDRNRKEMTELVKQLDHKKPMIMLDHQPNELGVAANLGVDLILSGHTHRGQVIPANFITNLLYENDYGYLKKGNLHSIVSSGFGTWGPPLRLGTQAEAVLIEVRFE